MARIDVSLSGHEGALSDLSALPGLAEQALTEAANVTAAATKQRALQLTTSRYNLSEEDLSPFIELREAVTPRGGASVTLRARPIPIGAFAPQVRMRDVTLTSRGARPKTYSRRLPTIVIKRFRKGSAKQLSPFFPLQQRTSGPLAADDRVRRRIGEVRDRLTVPRFYTFPKRFLEEIRPRLESFVGERGSVELRAAYRKWFKGQRVLRGPR